MWCSGAVAAHPNSTAIGMFACVSVPRSPPSPVLHHLLAHSPPLPLSSPPCLAQSPHFPCLHPLVSPTPPTSCLHPLVSPLQGRARPGRCTEPSGGALTWQSRSSATDPRCISGGSCGDDLLELRGGLGLKRLGFRCLGGGVGAWEWRVAPAECCVNMYEPGGHGRAVR